MTNRKSAADVDGQLRASSRKLEQLHWELQELNARAVVVTDKENASTSKRRAAWGTGLRVGMVVYRQSLGRGHGGIQN